MRKKEKDYKIGGGREIHLCGHLPVYGKSHSLCEATGSFYRMQDRGHPGGRCCHEVPVFFLLHLPACPGLEWGFLSWEKVLLFRLPRQYLVHPDPQSG